MTDDLILSDDHVAGLLVEEAQRGQGASGSGAFPAERRPANMPRPNTRFLQKIIQAGAREAERVKEKQPEPKRQESSRKTKTRDHDLRKRQMSGIHAILGESAKQGDRDGRPSSSREDRDQGRGRRRRDERPETRDGDLLARGSDHRNRHGRLTDDRHTSRDDERTGRRSRRDSDRPASEESDHELIGPAPPPKLRGRGTIGGAADLDRRFSASYDPKMDANPDSDVGGDWDDAVEAFRDRLKLKQNQEHRMRDAGFPEDQIRRAAHGGEKTEKDVVWSKAGEKRDWDRGKTVDDDGSMDMEQPSTLFSEDY
ncbi:hypothetical protein PLIIFM63780_004941 [Purpureocillium lilacinum]|nr:hypothetical protein PLIIFM63780_004941 [Purpureocillium lilacinum]